MASSVSRADAIANVDRLEELLSEPEDAALAALKRIDGDLVILGVGGKMGPTLARMARRCDQASGARRRIIGVSRFSTPGLKDQLEAHGIETIVCDLLDQAQLDSLPDAPNVVAMTGMKFGATGNESRTWAMNTYLAGMIAQKFRRSRIVAFSSGNVYGLSPVKLGGSLETDGMRPVGEYSITAMGRERIYEYFSRTLDIPMVLLRLNYATEMRYGVLVDVARKVHAGEAIDVTMGHLNSLWQGDANAMALAAFDQVAVPPRVINLAGPELLSVRRVAEEFGRLFGKSPRFEGAEADDGILSNGQLGHRLFGYPRVGPHQMIEWIADWVARGGESLDKPTHFEVRDGKF